MSRKGKFSTIFSEEQAAGQGSSFNVDEYRHIVVQVATSASADATLKCWGSMSATEPTWANAASPTNIKATKRLVNLSSGGSVNGDTGISPGGTDIVKEYKVNTDGLRFINFAISAYVVGKFTVKARGINDTRNA